MGHSMRTSTSVKRTRLAARRNRATLESARSAGLLGKSKNARVAGRVSAELIAAAKRSAGLSSDTEVIEIALAKLALEDDFGARLVRRKGSVPRELDIEL
jgi:Arc/MetJ family transcription regulator